MGYVPYHFKPKSEIFGVTPLFEGVRFATAVTRRPAVARQRDSASAALRRFERQRAHPPNREGRLREGANAARRDVRPRFASFGRTRAPACLALLSKNRTVHDGLALRRGGGEGRVAGLLRVAPVDEGARRIVEHQGFIANGRMT